MTIHELKTEPQFFHAIIAGLKTFEIRFNDRNFKVGDELRLREYDTDHYTGREIFRIVTYLTDFMQCEGYVVMSLGFRSHGNGTYLL